VARVIVLARTGSRGYLAARPMRALATLAMAAATTLSVAALSGCEGEPPKTALGYTDSAKHAYDLAMEQYDAHAWLQAETLLREVKRKYSYSKYARMAELRLADADLLQEKYPEAIRGYKEFMRAHRSDADDIAYARAKIAEAMCAEIPDSALMPAQEERDQASVVDAYKELKGYLVDYPAAKEAVRMRELLAQVTGRLVRHELYVARFYASRDNFDAAIARIRYALKTYSTVAGPHGEPSDSTNLEAEALLQLGQMYLRTHQWTEARASFEAILRSYAESPVAVRAHNFLDTLLRLGPAPATPAAGAGRGA
jgi:outer membrane protein assembly factor BamD